VAGSSRNEPSWTIDAVLAPDVAPRAVCAELQRAAAPDVLSFNRLREESGFHLLSCLSTHEMSTETRFGGYSQIATVESADAVLARVSKNLRSNLRTERNRLDKEGGGMIDVASSPRDVTDAFDTFVEVEQRGWKASAGALANRPAVRAALRQLLVAHAERDHARIRTLQIGERPIASHLCILHRDTLILLKTGYDEAYARLGPGNQLL
jgi:CelD/BcsL family acetyltransferase involved in cellulose biosynthesis